MKKILLTTIILLIQITAIAQNKKHSPSKPIAKSSELKNPKVLKFADDEEESTPHKSEKKMTIYEKLLKTENTLAFQWTLQKDTLLLSNQIYRKQIEIDLYQARLQINTTEDSVVLKKEDTYSPLSFYAKYTFFDVKLNEDIVTLTERETKKVTKFKLFLNTKKNEITKIQDLKSKEIYTPCDYEGPTIQM